MNRNRIQNVTEYLTRFLLGQGNEHLASRVAYGPDPEAAVVITPSGFFQEGRYLTEESLPALPLAELEGVPVLFGEPKVWEENGQVRMGADLIASAFFLVTRYEECVRRAVRDGHGRFPGKEALPYRAGFLNRPVVEEYGRLLRKALRQAGVAAQEPEKGFGHIWLTHDVDQIWTWDNYYRAARSTVKNLLTGKKDPFLPLRAVRDYEKYDPVYTFPELVAWDGAARQRFGPDRCTPVYFFMGCKEKKNTDTGYAANRERTRKLMEYLQKEQAVIGYHLGYTASMEPDRVEPEVEYIQAMAGHPIRLQRNHYLASREPEDFHVLLRAGIREDFTMGYADVAGFRLGTCRPIHWIDPVALEVTDLLLHPMTVMECTLDGPRYMGIQEEERAFQVVKDLVEKIREQGGEAVLLWHSPSVYPTDGSYQRSLYRRVLDLLQP